VTTLLSGRPGEIARSVETTISGGVREVKQWLLNGVIEVLLPRVSQGPSLVVSTLRSSPGRNVRERGFREWRRHTRSLNGFGSQQGIKNFATLWMLKENAGTLKLDWMEVLMP
jgi:hypothetical protein